MNNINKPMKDKLSTSKGWHGESQRHALAAMGRKTGKKLWNDSGQPINRKSFPKNDGAPSQKEIEGEPGLFSEHGWDAMEDVGRSVTKPGEAIAEGAEAKYGSKPKEYPSLDRRRNRLNYDDDDDDGIDVNISYYNND